MTKDAASANDSAVRRERLRAVFNALPILKGKEHLVDFAVNDLMTIDPTGPGTKPPHFKFTKDWRKGPCRMRKRVARSPFDPVPRSSPQQRKAASQAIGGAAPATELDRQRYQFALRAIRNHDTRAERDTAMRAKAAKGGRRVNVRAFATTLIATYHYTRLTGLLPKRRVTTSTCKDGIVYEYGPFRDFLAAIFSAIGLRKNVDGYSRFAVGKRTLRGLARRARVISISPWT